MKKLLLLSLLIIGCNNANQTGLPNPSDYAIWETPLDEDVERWATEIDTLWNSSMLVFFIENSKMDIEDEEEDEEYDVLKIKYQDITYQMMYDFIKAMLDSTYYTFENLNKYDTQEDFLLAKFPRLKEFSDDIEEID